MLFIGDVAIDDILEIPELPISPDSAWVTYLKIDVADSTGKWWGLYEFDDMKFREKPHSSPAPYHTAKADVTTVEWSQHHRLSRWLFLHL